MVMGVRDVTLKNVVPHLDEGYSLYGENFTQNSKVYVNGEKLKSSFLNNTRIDFSGVELVKETRSWCARWDPAIRRSANRIFTFIRTVI